MKFFIDTSYPRLRVYRAGYDAWGALSFWDFQDTDPHIHVSRVVYLCLLGVSILTAMLLVGALFILSHRAVPQTDTDVTGQASGMGCWARGQSTGKNDVVALGLMLHVVSIVGGMLFLLDADYTQALPYLVLGTCIVCEGVSVSVVLIPPSVFKGLQVSKTRAGQWQRDVAV
ncbi:hypothetical protein KIPB_011410 [Kipferlia bialata]|uniref:Uncharacterized protein n=1 Tax=Kipferlia bialata TaxID=797122 RepID=A0A9K3D6G7_9EUKA|nr:hypothetical protein KIPB_011410 [Kipferlia bialata]|eukprot:g11410.t1